MSTQKKKPEYELCSKNHKNSVTAKNCWVCGEPLDQPPKPQFIQKTQTTVTTITTPTNLPDLNLTEEECAQYVPGRERCDEKDPSGIPCTFKIMGCGIRDKRFKNKTP